VPNRARLTFNVRPIFERKERDATVRPQVKKWRSHAYFCADRLRSAPTSSREKQKACIPFSRKNTQQPPAPPSPRPVAEPAARANAPNRVVLSHGPSPLTPTFSFEKTVYTLDGARLSFNVRQKIACLATF
jgi:hypothetical protein